MAEHRIFVNKDFGRLFIFCDDCDIDIPVEDDDGAFSLENIIEASNRHKADKGDPDRFADIPKEANREEYVTVEIPSFNNPFDNVVASFEGTSDQPRFTLQPSGLDVTDSYNAWLKTLPQTHKVTFAWPEEA